MDIEYELFDEYDLFEHKRNNDNNKNDNDNIC